MSRRILGLFWVSLLVAAPSFGLYPLAPRVGGREGPPLRFLQADESALPERDAFFAAARDNLARSQREQQWYAYRERRTELHTNPFGRLGTGGTRTYEVHPASPGVLYRRLVERDGKPVANAERERQERRPRAQSKSSIDDVVETLTFEMERREVVDGRRMIRVRFEPKRDASPETREGRMAKIFKGTIWVDEEAKEVARMEAVAIDSMSYGLGLIARLGEGTTVALERERIDERVWLPTSVRVMGQGRAMVVRKLTIDYRVDWFDYKRIDAPKS